MSFTIDDLVKRWSELASNLGENNLNAFFTNFLWDFLGFTYSAQPNINPSAGGLLRPDYVLYDNNSRPLLYVETKARQAVLMNTSADKFTKVCQNNAFYKDAVFGETSAGIKDYLSLPNAARYGMVFNGDFWQLFRRVDGLILPLTDIQKVTKENLPRLIEQLQYYLNNPDRALIVSLWNRKGGVGKTTNIINISAVLAKAGKRVLVVDFDGQSDLTRGLGLDPNNYEGKILECFEQIGLGKLEKTLELLSNLITKRQFAVLKTPDQYSIDVLPTNRKTIEDFRNEGYEIKNKQTLLKRLLAAIANQYDYIFIDTSPDPDIATISSLFASDGLLIPADYDQSALHHAREISQILVPRTRSYRATDITKTMVADINPRLLGVVFSNHVDMGVRIDKKIQDFLNNASLKVYNTKLGVYAVVRQAKFAHQPVLSVSPNSKISKDYQDLTAEIFLNPNFIYE